MIARLWYFVALIILGVVLVALGQDWGVSAVFVGVAFLLIEGARTVLRHRPRSH
jgi:hypothetical protein